MDLTPNTSAADESCSASGTTLEPAATTSTSDLQVIKITFSSKNMTSLFATHRDSNGVVVLRPRRQLWLENLSRRQQYDELESRSAEIRSLYDQIDFLRSRVLPATNQPNQYHVPREIASISLDISVKKELKGLGKLINNHIPVCELLLEVQSAVARYQLGPVILPTPSPREPLELSLDPRVLLRASQPGISHTLYSEKLGFQSSDYRSSAPGKSIQALIDSCVLSEATLWNHCEDNKRPTSWISLAETAEWILEKCPVCRKPCAEGDQRSVAFINVDKLRRMNVLYQRSTMLAIQANIPMFSGSKQRGVKFTSPIHWLVYDWIPPQCVERIIPLQKFKDLYEATKPKGSMFVYPPEEMLKDLCLADKVEDLATRFEHQALR